MYVVDKLASLYYGATVVGLLNATFKSLLKIKSQNI